jgi:hypothetical protein
MSRFKVIIVIQLLMLFLGMQLTPSVANGEPLPPLPSPSVIDKVIRETGGAVFVPLYTPDVIQQQLAAFSGTFDNVENRVDFWQAVHYITTSGRLTETIIPLLNSRTAVLDPDFNAPGAELRPAKVIGATYQAGRGTMVVVAVFKPEAWQCPACEPPEKVRFYYNSTAYYEYSLY